jgi:hypothetical protein
MQLLITQRFVFLIFLFIATNSGAEMTLMDEPQSNNLTQIIAPIVAPIVENHLPILPNAVSATSETEWVLTVGHTISDDLKIWATQAGWKVIWNMQQDWNVPNQTKLTGDFPTAAAEVIKVLATNGALIHAQFYEGNKIMVVTGSGASE